MNLGYLNNKGEDNNFTSAHNHALMHYEQAIMYHLGTKLWSDHRNAFRLHKKYYCNHLMKPFGMSIASFSNCMKEYRALLCHLPPPSSKNTTTSFGANWNKVEVTEREIRAATYDALPKKYQDYICYHCKADWQDMSDNDFLNAMMAHKHFDNTLQFKKAQQEKKRKRKEIVKRGANLKDPDPVINKRSQEPQHR